MSALTANATATSAQALPSQGDHEREHAHGMSELHQIAHASISDQPLDSRGLRDMVDHAHAGALAGFEGVVRDHDQQASDTVVRLDYTAHPEAETALKHLCQNVLAAHREVSARIAVSHRVGSLAVGDVAVVVWVATAHRQAAFAMCQELIEAIKTELPVWKKQHQADGQSAWSGLS